MEPGDIIQVKFVCRLDDQTALNIRHWQVVNKAGTGATLAQFAAALSTAAKGPYQSLLATVAEYRGVTAQKIWPLPATTEALVADPGAGLADEDPLPRQTSGIIKLTTGLAGKRNRGRAYVPFPAESNNNAGPTPDANYIVNLSALANVLVAAVAWGTAPNTNQAVAIIWHRDLKTFVPIQNFVAEAKWATQRRRGDFGRPNLSPV